MANEPRYRIGEFEFNTISGQLRRTSDKTAILLGNNQAGILKFLIENFGKESRRKEYKDKLIAAVWNVKEVTDWALDKAVRRLRDVFGTQGD